jgi:uncharacterized protein YndB with AHSA1/START domain
MKPTSTPKPQTLKLDRMFHATPEKLWAYWTDPAKYAKWFNPAPIDLVIHEFDVRPGGRIRFDMPQPDGNKNPQEGVFHALTPHTEIVSGAPDKSFLLRVRFEPAGAMTRMVVEVTGVPPEYHAMATMGWNQGFDKLAALLAAPRPKGRAHATIVGRSLHLERLIRAPPAKVWAAWTTPSMLETWFWPAGKGKVREFDLRVGGRLVMAHEQQPWKATWEFVEIVPQQRIVIRDHWDDGSGHAATGTIEFLPEKGGTRLVVTHGPFPETGPYRLEDALGGFSIVADHLAELLETAEGRAEAAGPRRKVTLERVFKADVPRVWVMWTTKAGVEKWWGPKGFTSEVRQLDVRPSGRLEIAMTATAPEEVRAMREAGLDLTSLHKATFTEVEGFRKLAFTSEVDFVPGVAPYTTDTTVEFHKVTGGTKVVVVTDAMHSPAWTEMATQGWGSQLDKLHELLAAEPPGEGPGASQRGFTIERTFKASPQRVWDMWTTKAGLEKWWVPEGYTTKVLKLDVRPGGGYAIEAKHPQHTAVNHGTYTVVRPHTNLEWTWHFDIFLGPDDKPYDVPIKVKLEPAGSGTRMTFTQGPLARPEYTEGSRQGVLGNFEKLAKALGE